MVFFPPCKINLGLRVRAKRTDGFHELSTCLYPIPLQDVLEIIRAGEFSFETSGLPMSSPNQDNLCVKAYFLLKKDFDLSPVQMHLHKNIPMGAGLGGGSSDAAWTLRGLNEIFGLKLESNHLKEFAAKLGSDCPFFVEDQPMFATGRGEILQSIDVDLSGKFIVIIQPPIHLSTAEAYSKIIPNESGTDLRAAIINTPLSGWRSTLVNDFEVSVFEQFPHVKKVKESLFQLGAVYASMSGSGSAVFGIFEHDVDLSEKFPDMFFWAGKI